MGQDDAVPPGDVQFGDCDRGGSSLSLRAGSCRCFVLSSAACAVGGWSRRAASSHAAARYPTAFVNRDLLRGSRRDPRRVERRCFRTPVCAASATASLETRAFVRATPTTRPPAAIPIKTHWRCASAPGIIRKKRPSPSPPLARPCCPAPRRALADSPSRHIASGRPRAGIPTRTDRLGRRERRREAERIVLDYATRTDPGAEHAPFIKPGYKSPLSARGDPVAAAMSDVAAGIRPQLMLRRSTCRRDAARGRSGCRSRRR